MPERKFHRNTWKEQCHVAPSVREQHGVVRLSALEYLNGEKLMTYAETAVSPTCAVDQFCAVRYRAFANVGSGSCASHVNHLLEGVVRNLTLDQVLASP
jgi:hypothetical protein